jgi:hypothetical protein
MLHNQSTQAKHHLGTPRERSSAPLKRCGPGRSDSTIHVLDRSKTYLRNHAASRRIGNDAAASGSSDNLLPVNPMIHRRASQCLSSTHIRFHPSINDKLNLKTSREIYKA